MTAPLDARVLAALESVQDPCSIATRRPMSVVELGLLVDLDVAATGDVQVTLRATSPSCVLIGSIIQAAEERIGAVEGVGDVRIELDVTSDWSPVSMTASGRDKLEAGRAQARRGQAPRLPEVAYADAALG